MTVLSKPDLLVTAVERLKRAIERPLLHPASSVLIESVLARAPDRDELMARFAVKALETLSDGRRHDTLFIFDADGATAVWFNAWSGTHFEVLPDRYGEYLSEFCGMAFRMREKVGPLNGFLMIDAFVRGDANPKDSSAAEAVEIDIEASFLPGHFLGRSSDDPGPFPKALMLNRSLCSEEEVQALEKSI